MIEVTFPGSVRLIYSGKLLSASDRGDVTLFVYNNIYDFVKTVVKWSGTLTFDACYVSFLVLKKTDPTLGTRLSPSMIEPFIDNEVRKIIEDRLVSHQPSLDFKETCGLVGLGQQLCNDFTGKIDSEYGVVNNEFQDCYTLLANILLQEDKTKSLILTKHLITTLKPFRVDRKVETPEITEDDHAGADTRLDQLLAELDV
jgi:hypothetical protein